MCECIPIEVCTALAQCFFDILGKSSLSCLTRTGLVGPCGNQPVYY